MTEKSVTVKMKSYLVWYLQVLDKQTDIISEHMVDAVIICTGKYAYPAQPDLPGMQRFQVL